MDFHLAQCRHMQALTDRFSSLSCATLRPVRWHESSSGRSMDFGGSEEDLLVGIEMVVHCAIEVEVCAKVI